MIDFAASAGRGLTGQHQHQSKFQIFKMSTLKDAILSADELPWNVVEDYINFYSIKSKAEKMDGGFHKLSVYFYQRHFYRKWCNLDHLT